MPAENKAKQLILMFQVHSDALLACDIVLTQVDGNKLKYWLEVRGIIEEQFFDLRSENIRKLLSGSSQKKY